MRSVHLTIAAMSLLCVRAAFADVVTILPSKDASLFEPDVPEDQLSGGRGSLFVGRTGSGRLRRSMVMFDIARAVPAGSTITGARIELSVSRTRAPEAVTTVHRILADWGEGTTIGSRGGAGGDVAQPGDATWSHRFWPTDPWTSAGGDYAAAVLCEQTLVGIARYDFVGEALVAAAQEMLDQPQNNFGLMFVGDEINGITAKRLHARESTTTAARPAMIITYTPPCPSDLNRDGSVDHADIVRFFGGWDDGLASGDFNADGAVDGDDVIAFFLAWDSGC